MASPPTPWKLDAVIEASIRQVTRAKDGRLLWSWRVRLADALNRERPEDSLWRQQVLSYLTARETLPAFKQVVEILPRPTMRDCPGRWLEATRTILQGVPAAKNDHLKGVHFEDDVEFAETLFDLGTGVYAIRAAYSALPSEVARHESMYRDFEYARCWDADYALTETDDEAGTWDTAFWASLVAGGAVGTTAFDAESHREFWLDWLSRLVPKVRGPRSKALRSLGRAIR